MKGIGDFFVKLFLNTVGLIVAFLTLVYALSTKQNLAAWLASVSVLSAILLVVLSIQEIRMVLNLVFTRSMQSNEPKAQVDNFSDLQRPDLQRAVLDNTQFVMNKNLDFVESKVYVEGELKTDTPTESPTEIGSSPIINPAESQNQNAIKVPIKNPTKKIKSENFQFFQIVRKNKINQSLGQLEIIEDLYKKMRPYLAGERGLIISGPNQTKSPYSATLKQVLNGEKFLDQIICKNIYPDLDLLPDMEVNYITERKAVENILVGLWSDYYCIVILVDEWQEEFWRAVARGVNDQISLGANADCLTIPAIKRKRPISYQNLSRFDIFSNRNLS